MANTVIQLKHSTVQGNVPVSLANGEISINTRDGKIFYADPTGTIQEFTEFSGPSGLNQEIQFNDSGVLGANASLTFNKSTGYFKAPIIEATNNGNGTNFKVGDDAWIGDVNQADTLRISGQQNSANAYVIFGSSDTAKLGRAGTGPLTYGGAFTATGTVSGNELSSTQSSGDEGGQVNLAIPATGTSLTGSVTIDVYQNKLRFFQGDSAKGAYIDLTAAASGVGSNLLNPSETPDTVARNLANAAFIQANSAFDTVNNAVAVNLTQNTSITAAFNQANAAFVRANNSLNANTGGTITGNVTISANLTASNVATQTYIQFGDGSKQYTANAGSGGGGSITVTVANDPPASGNVSGDIWIDANTGNEFTWFSDGDSYQWVELGPIGEKGEKGDTGDVSGPFNQANAAFIQANAAYNQANTNTSDIAVIQGVNLTQNTSINNLEAVNLTQNTNISNIQGVNDTQNNRITYAENHANAAFLAANNATDTYVRNHANSAFHQANAAYAQANTNTSDIVVIQGVNLTQNTNISNIEGVNLTQNTNITIAQTKADNAFHQANAAYATANNEAGVNATQNTNITNAQNSAAAAFIRANNSLNANTGGVVTGPVTISANLNVLGNLIVSGNVKTIDTETLNITDPLIYLAANNYASDLVDIGFVGNYYDGSTQRHTGVIRKFGSDNFYIFTNYDKEPVNNLIDINDASFRKGTLYANLNTQLITYNGIDLKTYVDNAYAAANAATATDATQNVRITYAENHANAAFNAANNATDTYVRAHANAAFDQANAAFDKANTAGIVIAVDAFTGTGSCTTFALSTTPSNENFTIVSLDGAVQHKSTYSLTGANLIFSEAPANSTSIEVVIISAATASFLAYADSFTGTGACTTFTLTATPTSKNYTLVSLDGALQHKSTYNISGSNVVFTEAPSNSTAIDVNYFVASTLLDSSLTIYAANHANAAFIAANNATDTFVRNHANAAFNQANAAYAQANTANNTAVAAFNQANSKNLVVIGRSTNTYIPIVGGSIIIEGRTSNTSITIIS